MTILSFQSPIAQAKNFAIIFAFPFLSHPTSNLLVIVSVLP